MKYLVVCGVLAVLSGFVCPVGAQILEGIAILPADTIEAGPTSGQFIAPANNRIPPFQNKQPVQGISSVLRASNGDFLVMSDNGFGAQNNSQDYVLRVHRISPDFKTKPGGTGGDFTAVTDHQFLVIERDNFEGTAVGFKKIYLVDFDLVDSNGFSDQNRSSRSSSHSGPRSSCCCGIWILSVSVSDDRKRHSLEQHAFRCAQR